MLVQVNLRTLICGCDDSTVDSPGGSVAQECLHSPVRCFGFPAIISTCTKLTREYTWLPCKHTQLPSVRTSFELLPTARLQMWCVACLLPACLPAYGLSARLVRCRPA